LNEIPFEERRVIDELVKLRQTRYEPRDLLTHLDRLSGSWGSGVCASFFRQVYEDLRTDRRSKYAAFSSLEFKRFLEVEYSQHAQRHAEHQAQAKKKAEAEQKAGAERRAKEKAEAERQAQARVKKREEDERRARANFDALGKEMAKATTRA